MTDDAHLEQSIELTAAGEIVKGTLGLVREQRMKRLLLANCTDEKVRINLKFRTLNVEDEWQWLPDIGPSAAYVLDASRCLHPFYKGHKIFASRVRIRVSGETFEDRDFWQNHLWLLRNTYWSVCRHPYWHYIVRPGQPLPNIAIRSWIIMKGPK